MFSIHAIVFIVFVCVTRTYSDKSIDEIILEAEDNAKANKEPDSPTGMIRVDGDIMMTLEQYNRIYGKDKRNGLLSQRSRWTNNVVPYYIPNNLYSSREMRLVDKAIQEWQDNTCLTFRKLRRKSGPHIEFVNSGGCWSMVGMTGNAQKLSLGRGCRHHKIIVHEIGHALGMYHEQSRPDRDEHLTIVWSNIPKGREHNFKKQSPDRVGYFDVQYDYYSVMHYSATAFTITRGQPTIRTKNRAMQNVIGEVPGLSFGDVKMINNMYKCGGRCGGSCPGRGFKDEDCNCICPGNGKNGFPTKRCSGGPVKTKKTKRTKKTTTSPDCEITDRTTRGPTKNCRYKDKSTRCKQYSSNCFRSKWLTARCMKTCYCDKRKG